MIYILNIFNVVIMYIIIHILQLFIITYIFFIFIKYNTIKIVCIKTNIYKNNQSKTFETQDYYFSRKQCNDSYLSTSYDVNDII